MQRSAAAPYCNTFWPRLFPLLRWWPLVTRHKLKADLIAGLFGSSRHLISGPTTAISIVVFAAVSKFAEPGSAKFVQMALTLTFLAGVYQLTLGLARMGALVNFISHSVVVGVTAGAAVLIATSQRKHYFGVPIPAGESFLHTWQDLIAQLG
jgi:SulP family sulfate permease